MFYHTAAVVIHTRHTLQSCPGQGRKLADVFLRTLSNGSPAQTHTHVCIYGFRTPPHRYTHTHTWWVKATSSLHRFHSREAALSSINAGEGSAVPEPQTAAQLRTTATITSAEQMKSEIPITQLKCFSITCISFTNGSNHWVLSTVCPTLVTCIKFHLAYLL